MSRWKRWTLIVLLFTATPSGSAHQGGSGEPGATAQQAVATTNGAATQGGIVVDGIVVGKPVETRPGETCLLCDQPVQRGDPTYLVEGQRVPVHVGKCDDTLRASPRVWLARLKPRGALFDAAAARAQLSITWFFLGLYILVGLVFGALSAHRAFHVGRNPLAWLGVSLLINLAGYLTLLVLPSREVRSPAGIPSGLGKIPNTYAPENCPRCGAENHPSAPACSSCGVKLTPQRRSEVQIVGLRTL